MNDKNRNLNSPEAWQEAYELTKQYLFSKAMIDPGESRTVSRFLEYLHWKNNTKELVKLAPQDFIAHDISKQVAADLIDQGEPLPRELGEYIVNYLRTGKEPKRYRPKLDLFFRNVWISLAVHYLRKEGFWPTTRNEASESKSICDIVAQVITEIKPPAPDKTFKYDTIRKIWDQYENKILDPKKV